MEATTTSIYDIPVVTIDGRATTLAPHRGKVVLVVNVASKCAFTGQYAGLERLYQTYKERGLVILGFPCNQFMAQEPGDADAIKQVCSLKYNVTFPMFAKVNVNGTDAHPLYRHLKAAASGFFGTRAIKWNFTKFLVDRDGNVVQRFSALTKPEAMTAAIERLLTAPT